MLTVAVTGPTGEIGKPFVGALERCEEVGRILAMARREFDPSEFGWRKTEYRRGDILDRGAVDELVASADVVVHLAFIVVEATSDSYEINIVGSRNVFDAAGAAQVKRLVYTSSVAAYGYPEIEGALTEDMPASGTERHAYSHQKAEVERVLADSLRGAVTEAYVFRPCIVAGPQATTLLDLLPYLQIRDKLPGPVAKAIDRVPLIKPVLPDHGIPFQLVHHDDVASALVGAVLGGGEPGIYNLNADGAVSMAELAEALGWASVPIPKRAVDATAAVLSRIPPLEVQAGWLEALRQPVMMDSSRAKQELGWRPAYDAAATLRDLVSTRTARP